MYIGRKKNAAIFQKCSHTEFLQKLTYDIDLKVTLVNPVALTRILIMHVIPNHADVTSSFDEDMQPGLSIKTRGTQKTYQFATWKD